jgi:uncharacterized protein Usg
LRLAKEERVSEQSLCDKKKRPEKKGNDMSAHDFSAKGPVSGDFRRQLEGYGLTTANILYRRPDHPWLLQTYVWQDYDLCPKFPELNKFLNFWLEKLEGPLHSVTVAHARLIKPAEIKAIDGEFRLH